MKFRPHSTVRRPRNIAAPAVIEALEARIAPAAVLGLDENNTLHLFDSDHPGTILDSHTVSGLSAGQRLIGVDFRPANGVLYGLAKNSAGQGQLYTIDPHTGAATSVGILAADPTDSTAPYAGLNGFDFGFDFNPVADRLRVVSDLNQNLRIVPVLNATTGFVHVFTDTDLTPGGGVISGEAYTNNFAGATQTTLYGIDFATDTLVRQGGLNTPPGDSPNNGVLTVVGTLGITTDNSRIGFDIPDDHSVATQDTGIASLVVNGRTSLYSINLTTGFATSLGRIGDGLTSLVSLTDVPGTLAFKNARTATFTDVDGDTVTVKVSAGSLGLGNFRFGALTAAGGQQLEQLDLGRDGAEFAGANVKVSARRDAFAGLGDGHVNVGSIKAAGLALKNVTVAGDLGKITAGTGTGAALGRLDVVSLGLLGVDTQGVATASYDLDSVLSGSAGTVKVRTSVTGTFVQDGDSFELVPVSFNVAGNLDRLTIGGSTQDADLEIHGSVKRASFGGEVSGSSFGVTGNIETLALRNDLFASEITIGEIAKVVTVSGSVESSGVFVGGSPLSVLPLSIERLVIRGDVTDSTIVVGKNLFSGRASADVTVGDVRIGGNWLASSLAVGANAGADGKFGTADDVLNGTAVGDNAGVIASIASLRIRGQALGSDGAAESFGIVTQQLGVLRVGSTAYELATGPANDSILLGSSANFRARETGVFTTGGGQPT